jgi:hypothetical protein
MCYLFLFFSYCQKKKKNGSSLGAKGPTCGDSPPAPATRDQLTHTLLNGERTGLGVSSTSTRPRLDGATFSLHLGGKEVDLSLREWACDTCRWSTLENNRSNYKRERERERWSSRRLPYAVNSGGDRVFPENPRWLTKSQAADANVCQKRSELWQGNTLNG